MTTHRALRVERTASFELLMDAEDAFPQFSPEGEALWLKGWVPRPIFPSTHIAFESNTVFSVEHNGEHSLWQIVEVDHRALKVDYIYLVEASRMVRVTVRVQSVAPQRSQVTVDYMITTLGESGDALASSFTENALQEKVLQWKRLIEASAVM